MAVTGQDGSARGSGYSRLTPLHLASALLIVAMWGLNFTVIRFGLDEFTPFAFATWRFVLGALPILFVPKPAISWGTLAGIGGFMFTGQFVFLFFAMEAGLPPGLTSVLVQMQGPLTVVLAALFLREHATRGQWLGLAVALVGVVLIAAHGRRHGQPLRPRTCADVGAHLGDRQPLLPLGARRLDVRGDGLGERAAAAPPRHRRAGDRRADGAPRAAAGADLARLVRALLHGRSGDVAGLPDLGHAAAHLSGREDRASLAAGALCGA